MRLVSRAAVLAATLLAAHPRPLAAQFIDRGAVGARVRAETCDADDVRGRRELVGDLHSQDSALVVIEGRRGRDSIPVSRVRWLELRTKRSRELGGVGMLAGIALGVFGVRFTLDPRSEGYDALIKLPLAVIGGAIVGYGVGTGMSGSEQWDFIPLAPGHGSVCGDG